MQPTLLPLSRRHFVIGSGMAIGGFGVPVWAQTPSVAPDGFRILPIRPAVLATDPPNGTWSYDGMVPGPTLRVRRGEELRVRLINGMAEPTAVHWHGVRLPNAMDGSPPLTQAPTNPGASFDYVSGCPLDTESGVMNGSYRMVDEDGTAFDVQIPRFQLLSA